MQRAVHDPFDPLLGARQQRIHSRCSGVGFASQPVDNTSRADFPAGFSHGSAFNDLFQQRQFNCD